MSMVGMNVESILTASNQMLREADRLDEALRKVDALVDLAGRHWRGPNLSQFRGRWEGQYRRAGVRAAADLRQLADLARRNAEAQRRTSATLDGSAAAHLGGLPGAPVVPGPITTVPFWKEGLDWLGRKGAEAIEWTADGIEWVNTQVDAGAKWASDQVDAGAKWLSDQAQAGADWVVDRAEDIGQGIYDFVAPRIDAAIPALVRLGNAEFIVADQVAQIFTEGRIPQTSEVLAAGALVAGTFGGVFANAWTGQDQKFLDPGQATAGQPRRDPAVTPVTNFDSLTSATMSAYQATNSTREDSSVRIDAVTGPDKVIRYIVSIPGTESVGGVQDINSWLENFNGHNWSSNLYAMAQGSMATDAQQIRQAMANAGIPAGAEILLTGHSQGGLVAANLAADPEFASSYKVSAVVTYGSPVDCADFPATGGTPVLSVAHGNRVNVSEGPLGIPIPTGFTMGDPVPQLDFGGNAFLTPFSSTGDNITSVNLEPHPGSDIMEIFTKNHDQASYSTDVANNLSAAQKQSIAAFEAQNGLGKFYAVEGTTATTVRVPIGAQ